MSVILRAASLRIRTMDIQPEQYYISERMNDVIQIRDVTLRTWFDAAVYGVVSLKSGRWFDVQGHDWASYFVRQVTEEEAALFVLATMDEETATEKYAEIARKAAYFVESGDKNNASWCGMQRVKAGQDLPADLAIQVWSEYFTGHHRELLDRLMKGKTNE